LKPTAIQLLSGAAIFSSMVFIPTYAEGLGASRFEIGIIGAAYAFAAFVSSFAFGRLADVRGRRTILRVGLIASAGAALTQILAEQPAFADHTGVYVLAGSRALLGFSAGMFPAALLAYAGERGKKMGKFVSFGSIGWGLGSFAAGVIGVFWGMFLFSSIMFTLCFLIALTLPESKATRLKVPLFPVRIIRRNIRVYGAMLIRHTGANMIWIIFPIYLGTVLRLSLLEIGILYAVNPATQFAVMQSIDRFRSETLVAVGILAAMMTFVSFLLARNFWEMLPPHILLGTSWACLYVGSLKYVMERNVEKATSMGMLQSAISIASTAGPFAGGIIAAAFGLQATIYAAAGMATIALIMFLATWGRDAIGSPAPSAQSQG
jgi:MFS family permease